MSTPKRNVRRSLFTNGPAYKRAKSPSVNSLVRKAVLRSAETKKKEYNGTLYGGGLTGVNSATFGLSSIPQGTDDGERIGNKILCTGVDIQLLSLAGPVRVILFSPKDPSAAPTPPAFTYKSLLDLDSVNVYHDWIYNQSGTTALAQANVGTAVVNYKSYRQIKIEYFAGASNNYATKPLFVCIAPLFVVSGVQVDGTLRMWYKDM